MFSLARKFLNRPSNIFLRSSSTSSEKWDIVSAVSLERLPVVTRELKDVERRFFEMLNRHEKENSHRSDFELRVEADKKRALELEKGANLDLDSLPQQTSNDFLDACGEEFKKFKFSKRLENAQIENDRSSLKRAKDRRLLLIVKDQIDEKSIWLLPHKKYENEPSLRETAEMALREKCGPNLRAKFLGNAPAGFYKYKYPKSRRNETVGAKVFFFKAQLVDGNVDEKLCPEFQWATRNELGNLHEDYRKSVTAFLIDEEH
ncbi:ribosomal protein, L46 [Nesidiocoris tenuis]|uniref:Large ribosomal subunit protein mL46 n=1 Tax=Nesidiocoris tenuis TaxID=355587 RepID=A0ABN7B4V8_9HEMI|nr:ribosomal protein, L46 [Nesidiocoris tenuis]